VRTNAWDDRTVLGKAFSILDAFIPGDRWLRLADITERTGYPKATVHRLTTQLVEWGALQKIDNWLRLGSHLFEVGYMVPHFRLLRESAGPLLVDLHSQTKLTVKLAVLETTEWSTDVLFLDRLGGSVIPLEPVPVGGRGAAYSTALGKAMLAHSPDEVVDRLLGGGLAPATEHTITEPESLRRQLDGIRDAGVAYDLEETRPGVVCVAAAVFPPCQQLAAVSVTAPSRVNVQRFASAVRDTAGMLTRALRRARPPAPFAPPV
jgi:DNA-binding IclR family transcriptional regulator